jgi:competence protein ComEA
VDRTTLLVAGAMVAAAIGAAWLFRVEPAPAARSVAPPATVVEREALVVHVSGRVAAPGLVTLDAGSRVADAVAAAGGLLPDADLTTVNLAATVVDGGRIHIPALGTGPTVAPDGGDPVGKVAVNRATAADLERLPGVGPVLAGRIIGVRDDNGPFEAVEDLLDVPGIGERVLETLRDLVEIP